MATAEERAQKMLEKAMKRLGENPVAIVMAEGDADAGQLFEAADAVVAIACGEARGLKDRALSKAAKVVRKDWGRFLGNFRMLAQETKRVMEMQGDEK